MAFDVAAAASKVDVPGVFFNFGGVVGEGEVSSDMPLPIGLIRRSVTAPDLRDVSQAFIVSVLDPSALTDVLPFRDFFRPKGTLHVYYFAYSNS